MYPFNLPLSAPAWYWVPIRLSKHRFSHTLSQHQSNSQAEWSKQTSEDFKISKRKRTRGLSEYIPIHQPSLQCDICIPNHLVTRPVTKGRASPPEKTFYPPEKFLGRIVCITNNHCFRTCHGRKIWAFVRKFFAPLAFQAGYGSAGDCCLLSVMPLSSVFSQTNFSGLASNFNRWN